MPNLSQSISLFCREVQKHTSVTEILKVGFAFPRLSQNDLLEMMRRYEQTIQAVPGARKSPSEETNNYPDQYRKSISVPASTIPAEIFGMSKILKDDQVKRRIDWLVDWLVGQLIDWLMVYSIWANSSLIDWFLFTY